MPARRALRPLLAALVVTVAASGPAGAQEPPPEPAEPRVYRGETQQDRRVSVRTGTDGLVDRVRIGWVASTCRRGRSYGTTTVDTPPFDAVSADRLRDAFAYVERSRGGIRARVAVTLVAERSGRGARERWSGTVRARVVVRRAGRRVDTCRTRRAIRWTARLEPGTG
jgi:hypothetical protein